MAISGLENALERKAILVPNFLDISALRLLEKEIGRNRVTFVLEDSAALDGDIEIFLSDAEGEGLMFSSLDLNPASVGQQFKSQLDLGRVLIFVPGKVSCVHSTLVRVLPQHLDFLCSFGLDITPIFYDAEPTRLSIEKNPAPAEPEIFCGNTIAFDEHSRANLTRAWHDLEASFFAKNPILEQSLASVLFRGMKKFGKAKMIDGTDDSSRTFGELLAASIAFSRRIKKLTSKRRVGILLPPGKASAIANLAVIFAGKIPVNLNFTASREGTASCIEQADLDRFITADPFVRKLPDFSWPPMRDLVFLEREFSILKKSTNRWFLLTRLLPTSTMVKILGLNKHSGDDEAALLFTSGSSGDPKGVALTHKNLITNVLQFSSRLGFPAGSRVLSALPIFHSFGLTATLLFPLIEGFDIVSYPSPLDSRRISELISTHKVDIILLAPTFLHGFLKRAKSDAFKDVKLLVTGAEKLSITLADAFEQKFGIRPLEGYGLTETSPVSCFNLPKPADQPGAPALDSHRDGSIGQLMPGIAVKITNPVDNQIVPLDESGMIWLRGPNVFNGYLHKPELSRESLIDGWFRTGDIGRVDSEGFIYIEGRLARFSKIAGEMVPHELLETAIARALDLSEDGERKIAVVRVPDAQKGEAVAVLSTTSAQSSHIETIGLRYKLMDAGIPALWCPKYTIPVSQIPILSSGKLDLKRCEEIALAAVQSERA